MLDGADELFCFFQSRRSLEYVCYCAHEVKDEALKRLLGELPKAGVTLLNLEEGLHVCKADGQMEVCAKAIAAGRKELSPNPACTLLLAGSEKTLALAKDTKMATIGYGALAEDAGSLLQPDMLVEGFEEVDVAFLDRVMKRAQGLPWVTLVTERCYLREITADDLDDLYELYAQPGITDYTEPLYERAEEEQYTRDYIANMYRFYGYGMWLVCDRTNDSLIGRAGFAHRDLGDEIVLEMGYVIDVPYQRQGYAFEVCQTLLSYAKEELSDFEEVNCFVEPGNVASHGLMKKLCFEEKGTIQVQQKQLVHYCKKL